MYHSNFPSLIIPIGQSVLSFFHLSGWGHWKCNQQQGVKYIYPFILLWHFLRMIRMYYGDVFEEVWRNISNGWSSDSGRTMPLDNTGHICWFTIFSALSRRQAMVNNRVETAVAVTGGSGGAVRSCAGCGGRISDRFLLFSMDRYWHTRCLKCSCCQAQLGEIGSTCFSKGGMILCKNDYIRY